MGKHCFWDRIDGWQYRHIRWTPSGCITFLRNYVVFDWVYIILHIESLLTQWTTLKHTFHAIERVQRMIQILYNVIICILQQTGVCKCNQSYCVSQSKILHSNIQRSARINNIQAANCSSIQWLRRLLQTSQQTQHTHTFLRLFIVHYIVRIRSRNVTEPCTFRHPPYTFIHIGLVIWQQQHWIAVCKWSMRRKPERGYINMFCLSLITSVQCWPLHLTLIPKPKPIGIDIMTSKYEQWLYSLFHFMCLVCVCFAPYGVHDIPRLAFYLICWYTPVIVHTNKTWHMTGKKKRTLKTNLMLTQDK